MWPIPCCRADVPVMEATAMAVRRQEAPARRLAALARHTSPRPPSRGAAHSPFPSHTSNSSEAGWESSTLFDPGNAITGGYYGHKGLLSPLPAVQAELDRLSTAELAAASVPSCLLGEDMPVLWGREEWAAVERRQQEPLFDMVALREQLAAANFSREGVAVLRGVMTPDTTRRWTEALQRCQDLNDRVISSDWRESIDWAGLRTPAPTAVHTPQQKADALGGAQRLRPISGANGGLAMRLHGTLPEYFPPGSVPYLMELMFHPQMVEVHRLCLGCERVYHELVQLLSKAPGDKGGGWHSHAGGAGIDDKRIISTPRDLEEYQRQNRVNLVLAYPRGFGSGEDSGSVAVIRGSHLFRDTQIDNSRFKETGTELPMGAEADRMMERGWMKGMCNPLTGEKLRCEVVGELEPGSLVVCATHTAHRIEPTAEWRPHRLAYAHFMKKADEETGFVTPPSTLPPVWSLRARRGELPAALCELLQNGHDRRLTGGILRFDEATGSAATTSRLRGASSTP